MAACFRSSSVCSWWSATFKTGIARDTKLSDLDFSFKGLNILLSCNLELSLRLYLVFFLVRIEGDGDPGGVGCICGEWLGEFEFIESVLILEELELERVEEEGPTWT